MILLITQSVPEVMPSKCPSRLDIYWAVCVIASLLCVGIATSLKILFTSESCSGAGDNQNVVLERNEVIALVNLLERLSKSIEIVRDMSAQLVSGGEVHGSVQEVTKQPLQLNL